MATIRTLGVGEAAALLERLQAVYLEKESIISSRRDGEFTALT